MSSFGSNNFSPKPGPRIPSKFGSGVPAYADNLPGKFFFGRRTPKPLPPSGHFIGITDNGSIFAHHAMITHGLNGMT